MARIMSVYKAEGDRQVVLEELPGCSSAKYAWQDLWDGFYGLEYK